LLHGQLLFAHSFRTGIDKERQQGVRFHLVAAARVNHLGFSAGVSDRASAVVPRFGAIVCGVWIFVVDGRHLAKAACVEAFR
jgi:hypothetical protein